MSNDNTIETSTALATTTDPTTTNTATATTAPSKEEKPEVEKGTKPVRKPADILCNCPQKCHQRVPSEVRTALYKEFTQLTEHFRQNQYLQSYIEMRSVYKRLWTQEERVGGRLQRRVSCKYRIPLEVTKPIVSSMPHETKPKLQTNSKGKTTYVVGVKEDVQTIEVCQKAFMNVYGITEKRIRLQREKLIAKLRSDTGILMNNNGVPKSNARMNVKEYQSEPVTDEFYIVDSFFRNQLWRPEYIGMASDKFQYLDVYHSDVKV